MFLGGIEKSLSKGESACGNEKLRSITDYLVADTASTLASPSPYQQQMTALWIEICGIERVAQGYLAAGNVSRH